MEPPSRVAAATPRAAVATMGRSRAPKTFTEKAATAVTSLPPAEEEINPGAVEGTDLRVLEYPHPLLRAPNEEVAAFDDSLRTLSAEMFSIMYASRGVGLAAPQLGINKRLMVFNPEGKKKAGSEVLLCNPQIVEMSGAKEVEEEGCLSFPGMSADVERSGWIEVEFQNGRGKTVRKKYVGWEARIFQHEYDHLDGVLYVDRLDEAERARVQPDLDQLVEAHGPGGAL